MKKEKKETSLESFIRKSKLAHGDKYLYSKVKYKHSHKKVKIKCPKHGIFEQMPRHHVRGHGCSKCKGTSKGEEIIFNELSDLNISFRREVPSDEIFNIDRKFRFDFLIEEKSLFIEFDGKQHFCSKSFNHKSFKNRDNFEKRYERDISKNQLVIESNEYNMIRIPYWEQKKLGNIIHELFKSTERMNEMIDKYSYQSNLIKYINKYLLKVKY